jgi:RNA polymerase sigma-70 factor (ECF subfamily)
VARRFESRINAETKKRTHGQIDVDAIPVDDSRLSQIFEREWAKSIMRQAAERQRTRAEQLGDAALARVELLRLRFEEELPIREIAKLWQVDAPVLHREYARARQEFKDSLHQVVAFHFTGSHMELQREIAAILAALQ